MIDTGGKDRRWRASLMVTSSVFTKYLLSIIGGVLTITGFAALITESAARAFVKKHPYPIYLVLVVAVLVIMATLNYAYALRKRNAQLVSLVDRSKPVQASAHDVRFFAEVLCDIPEDGHVVAWLKRTPMTELSMTDFPADVLSALERTEERPRLRPVGFDDRATAEALRVLTDAIDGFRASVEHWTLVQHNARWVRERARLTYLTAGDRTIATSATSALEDARVLLVQAYDAFLIAAHERGVDAGPRGAA